MEGPFNIGKRERPAKHSVGGFAGILLQCQSAPYSWLEEADGTFLRSSGHPIVWVPADGATGRNNVVLCTGQEREPCN